MTPETLRRSGLGLLAAVLLAVAASVAFANTNSDIQDSPPAPEVQAEDDGVQEEIDKQLAERRKAMLDEAHAALDETNAALQALDEGNAQGALDALARVTGKLELLVARDPDLALAPVDVDFVTHDLYARPSAVRAARDRAEDLLEDGRVQEARGILSGLASEIVVRVTNLPLATYPDAIKAISPLIDDGKLEEAKAALNVALGTLVVTNNVVSLPVLRARGALDEAEELIGAESPTDEDRKKVDSLVHAAREHLEMAELLGYGNEEDHEAYRRQIAELEGKLSDDKDAGGVFAKLRKSLDGFQTSFFE